MVRMEFFYYYKSLKNIYTNNVICKKIKKEMQLCFKSES